MSQIFEWENKRTAQNAQIFLAFPRFYREKMAFIRLIHLRQNLSGLDS